MKNLLKIFVALLVLVSLGFAYKSTKGSATGDAKSTGVIYGKDDIRSLTYKMVNEKLRDPYMAKVNKKDMKKEYFSRCPSGYQVRITEAASIETAYSFGKMWFYEGCDGEEICSFRARLSDKSVEILQGDSVNYVAVDLWIKNATSSVK